jgi:hypothetical protein
MGGEGLMAPAPMQAAPAPGPAPVDPPPPSALFAWQQWWARLALSPIRQARLADLALHGAMRFASACIAPAAGSDVGGRMASASNDPRFEGPAWQQWPYNLHALGFSLQQSWWREATRPLPGLPVRAQRLVEFAARQMTEAMSPANFPLTNHAGITFALTTGGHNAGVVNPPPVQGAPARRHYQIATRPAGDPASTLDPQRWRDLTPSTAGSWWTPWQTWLSSHGSGETEPPASGHDGLDYGRAPGWYVRRR